MIRSDSRLYFYQCGTCGSTAVAARKAGYGDSYQCVLCRRYLKFVYVIPVETDEQRGWFNRGLVYNPGVGKDPEPGSMREIPKASSEPDPDKANDGPAEDLDAWAGGFAENH